MDGRGEEGRGEEERERERDRYRDRQRESQRERERESETYIYIEREIDREVDREREGDRERCDTCMHTHLPGSFFLEFELSPYPLCGLSRILEAPAGHMPECTHLLSPYPLCGLSPSFIGACQVNHRSRG